ncbi:DNA-binding MarR family transcriptional regulator [Clostridium tetanomorphum]|uniref:hypothetical protein n=1 Tax=Clostridium tetanomorphum TaxID=1553 RepID=UPI000453321E|nr:hypothetical protein [Clostridium tetanomorphum]KAJ51692.1 putative MarR family transcriptional regulator [Clostridium tetanomorphum DSM 665]MBP1865946.1 DNA-binding MarR family transcriptional regulator [Clostridium tetanomorphum]NRS86127.1 DNA-binding MarR family transcriptional regulator [Clostridium tetanomorphum]NRZ95852.1 DNA-binding MarR family transcriptional regulator [Clostridium tetanomorphum]SQB89649.1 MarR family transcriptional regulator [Clostridium tetanomorphum]
MNEKENIVESFICMIEKIANGKMNVLCFGSEDMTFFRGEIHIIKIIGDNSETFSSEIARKLWVTRAVIHKTLIKLQNRDIIFDEIDDVDKKKKSFI